MIKSRANTLLHKRLFPLYIAAFLHGFVLWYAVEKIFMKSIGFNDASIGGMIALYSAVMLLAETPSGILADRWSRKGVLIIASISLSLGSLIGGFSNNQPIYLLSAAFWGIFFAMYSGTYESIVYDTELEMTGSGKGYERYFGLVRIADSAGLVLGSLAGGLVATIWTLRTPYFLTIPFSLAAIIALLAFREPKLHKQLNPGSMYDHVRDTLSASLRNKRLLPVMFTSIILSILTYIIFEFSQLWVIELGIAIAWFGPINALILSSIGIAGWLVTRLKIRQSNRMFCLISGTLLSALGLVVLRNPLLVVLCLFFISVSLISISIVFSKFLHDGLHSKVRAGAASAVSTVGRSIIIPLSLLFGFVSEATNIFQASWILVGFVIILSFIVAWSYKNSGET